VVNATANKKIKRNQKKEQRPLGTAEYNIVWLLFVLCVVQQQPGRARQRIIRGPVIIVMNIKGLAWLLASWKNPSLKI
jgi:hypothetical protein